MALFLFIAAGISGLGALQERLDYLRCASFLLVAVVMLLLGIAVVRQGDG